MMLLGLTGSIGMGKSLTLGALRVLARGAAFYDADAAVHLLYQTPQVVSAIKRAFPDVATKHGIDREKLGAIVFKDPRAKEMLTRIIYPRLALFEHQVVRDAARRRAKLVVLDIPLLFETDGDRRVDHVLVVSAPAFVQEARVLARPGMDKQRFRAIRAVQMADTDKRKLADFIVPTGLGRAHTARHLQKLLRMIKLAANGPVGRRWRGLAYLKEFYARSRP